MRISSPSLLPVRLGLSRLIVQIYEDLPPGSREKILQQKIELLPATHVKAKALLYPAQTPSRTKRATYCDTAPIRTRHRGNT